MRTARATGLLVYGALLAGVLAACAGAAPSSDSGSASTTGASATVEPSTAATPAASPSGTDAGPALDDSPTAGTTVITSPTSGAVVDGPTVTVEGQGTAFEATLRWEVVAAGADGDSPNVAEGYADAGANGEVGPFTFTVDLTPGDWTIRVWAPGEADGGSAEGSGDDAAATVTVTVR
ncbi:Gmad2 immunoglobulin-like domain-containing protein [Cellulomonas soli]|uniref:Bacterial spore germination immunoglobulin-like domain-containing protein n=1 Tax=Cellulomonas soli TaxID=931535 RepID=A0A512PDJ8_9CELL|nr:Gmad2 immunoglobulin-like domain-containing protein [Cellulomonas soli]NYI60145.1 hypothetical protein [Cellulomonas soli]GEP69202.1 hypothetical protein CSO01_19170 [Cellulomonas soli]